MAKSQSTAELPPVPVANAVRFAHIPGAPGYCAGDDGSIWSCARCGQNTGRFRYRTTWTKLNPAPQKKGHLTVRAVLNGKRSLYLVNRLVLLAFRGPPPDPTMQSCHFPDRNPANNRLENLRWGTQLDNAADAIAHGTTCRGSGHGQSKLTEDQIPAILKMLADGRTYKAIGIDFGVSHGVIGKIDRNEIWQHVSRVLPDGRTHIRTTYKFKHRAH